MATRRHIFDFQHDPLPDPTAYIRLLEVVEVHKKSLSCRLTTWPIHETPTYTAISYAWGDPKRNSFILINDKRFPVRRNCKYALKQAKWYSDKHHRFHAHRYIWCDAICIDQTNPVEKGHQVSAMSKIYQSAGLVLACVGHHREDSKFLLQTLKHGSILLEFMYQLKTGRYGIPYQNFTGLYKAFEDGRRIRGLKYGLQLALSGPWLINLGLPWMHCPSTLLRLIRAMDDLMGREYFGRLWVYQELVLGKRIILCCGEDNLTIKALSAFATCFTSLPCALVSLRKIRGTERRCIPEITKNVVRTTELLKDAALARPRDRSLAQVMSNPSVRDLDCSDNRDKVYGILSVVSNWRGAPIQADYELGAFELGVKTIMELPATASTDIEFLVSYLRLDSDLSTSDLEASAWRQRAHPCPPPWDSEIARTESYERFVEPSGQHYSWQGIKLAGDPINNLIDTPPTNELPLIIKTWTCLDLPADKLGTRKSESMSIFLLPSQARPGDWFLFSRLADAGTRPALIARPDAAMETRLGPGCFPIVGRGLVWQGKYVDGLDLSPYSKQSNFEVHWAVGDAIVLASTFDRKMNIEEREQVASNMTLGICGMEGSTYARIVSKELPQGPQGLDMPASPE